MNKSKHNHNWRSTFFVSFCFFSVFIAICMYLTRGNIFKQLIRPITPFQIIVPPSAPDYKNPNSWVKINLSRENKVKAFFVYPTIYYNGKLGWNAPFNQEKLEARLKEDILPNHLAPFSNSLDLWVPYYRQATLFSMMAQNEDAKDALNLAYQDIDKAWDVFATSLAPNEKFVLVGINQGGLHNLRLLQSKIIGTKYESQLAIAYFIDQPIPQEFYQNNNFGALKPCTTKNQTNCIFSYIINDINNDRIEKIIHRLGIIWDNKSNYSRLNNRPIQCTNPLNGGTSDFAPASENMGAVSATNLDISDTPALLPGATFAKCQNGILNVETQRPSNLRPRFFELGTAFKTSKYNLFYSAIENDLENRLKSIN